MAEETTVVDARGRYMQAQKNGQQLNDAEWRPCRVLLTTRRLVLAADEQIAIPLVDIDRLGDRFDVNQAATSEADYTTIHVGADVLLVAVSDHVAFETSFYRASLDGAIIYVCHPAVRGGVVQDVGWQRGRAKVTQEAIHLVAQDGTEVTIERDDIGELETGVKRVDGEDRAVVEVEHTDGDGVSVETHLSGREHHISVLRRLLSVGAAQNRANVDLDPIERRVVMALYSGVSPFGISEFVGIDVEKVERIYDRLIELDVIAVERERTEVALTAQGRTVASEAIGERRG